MASELNMYESQVAEHKMDIDRLQRELQEVKKKYYLQKKKEHTLRYTQRSRQISNHQCAHYLCMNTYLCHAPSQMGMRTIIIPTNVAYRLFEHLPSNHLGANL